MHQQKVVIEFVILNKSQPLTQFVCFVTATNYLSST